MSFNRLTALFLLLLASAWVALVNGQPLFLADTSAYVRGPDFAVVYFFGKQFASSWTQDSTLQSPDVPSPHANDASPVRNVSLDSPFDKAVLAGRSVYYGGLLYISHLSSSMWLAVFAQALIFLYLSYTFIIKCLRLSFLTFFYTTLAISAVTPVSFFISFLMPDIFASFLILATVILAAFWDALRRHDKIFISAIILYSAITHTSHLLLLICIGILFASVSFFVKSKVIKSRFAAKRAIILFALILVGILSEQAFSLATRHTIGADPVRPPFLMARLIADGPGYQFLQKNCATRPYVVCIYIDRLPTAALAFLWSTDPKTGIFSVADAATRKALSAEQLSFAFEVFRFDPLGVITSASKNFIAQSLKVGLNEFFPNQQQVLAFKGKLPALYFNQLLRSRIIFRDWILAIGNDLYSAIYYISTLGLILILAVWPFVKFQKKSALFPQPEWFQVLTISVIAIIFNAAICGALSEPAQRYQARISWIPLFILVAMFAKLWEAYSPANGEPDLVRRLSELLPRPLRFLGVGCIGLTTDVATFTVLIAAFGPHPLIARLGSLAIATLVTWRLNRALTFDPSGRRQQDEAVRYAIVTMVAQGTSYAVFAVLVLTAFVSLPQVAIIIGAAVGAVLSYKGHHLLSFAPKVAHSNS